MAVAFFFVLGGFSMTLGYKEKVLQPEFSYKHYLTRRCIKFFPLHWLTLLCAIPLVLLSFSWETVPVFFINAALLQTWIPIKDVYFSYNAVSWYLADTMFFVLVFPLLFKWIVRARTPKRIVIAVVFVLVYSFVVFYLPTDLRQAILYVSPYMRMTDFIFGVFLAFVYIKLKRSFEVLQNNSIVLQLITIVSIILLVIESCIIPESTSFLAPIYWPLVAITIMAASLSSTNKMEVRGG